MHIIKKIFITTASLLLLVVLLLGVPLSSVSRTITSEDTMAGILSSELIYSQLRAAADDLPLDQLGSGTEQAGPEGASKQVFFDKEAYGPLVDKYLDYDFYKTSVGAVASGIYDWLNGITPQPQFTIQITQNPAEFKALFVDLLLARYHSFEPCPAGTPAELQIVFEAECRLPQVTDTQLTKAITSELEKSDLNEFINNATISSEEFASNLNPQDSERTKRIFGIAKALPLAAAGIALVLLGLLALLVYDKRRILKALGMRLLIPGALLLLTGLIVRFISPNFVKKALYNTQTDNASFLSVANAFAQQLVMAVGNRWVLYSAALVLLGVGGIIGQRYLNHDPIHWPAGLSRDTKAESAQS